MGPGRLVQRGPAFTQLALYAQLGADGLLSPIEPATLRQVRPGLSSGKGLWVAYAARARVLYYNPTKIAEADPNPWLQLVRKAKGAG